MDFMVLFFPNVAFVFPGYGWSDSCTAGGVTAVLVGSGAWTGSFFISVSLDDFSGRRLFFASALACSGLIKILEVSKGEGDSMDIKLRFFSDRAVVVEISSLPSIEL